MKRLYSMPNKVYNEWLDNESLLDLHEYIRTIGFRSCKFISKETFQDCYWEFSDEDYTWFLLRWS